MPHPQIRVLGVYRVDPTGQLFHQAMSMKYGGLMLSTRERAAAEAAVREELSSIALIELAVDNPDEQFNVSHFVQPGSDQAPYDEAYLSPDGSTVQSKLHPPPGASLRLAFFLHFFKPGIPLGTTYGEVPLPAIDEMPERLQRLLPYEPVT